MRRFIGKLAWMIFCALISSDLFAQVRVASSVVSLEAGDRPVLDVTVLNEFPQAIYVVPEIARIVNPGEKKDKFEPSDDIIVSPKRFSIPAKSERKARLILKKGFGEDERVYRLVFTPAPPPEDLELEEAKGEKIRPFVRVITTIGLLVFVEPKVPAPNFDWTVEGKKVIFRNTGNIHIKLDEVLFCYSKEKPDCRKSEGKRIYPGQTFEVSGNPQDAILKFRKTVGESKPEGQVSIKLGG